MWKVLFHSNGLRKDMARSRRRSFGPTSTKVTEDGRSLEVCSINLGNCVQKLAGCQRKKGGATTCAVKFDDPRGVFNRKKSIFDRVTRNFDCHVFEKFHRCSWNTHEGCKFEWDVWKWLISKLTRSYGRRDCVFGWRDLFPKHTV